MLDLRGKRIDWTNFNILVEDSKHKGYFYSEFGIGDTEISPEEYFMWAKEVAKKGDKLTTREVVEIINNIKRFIDCKCESFLKCYGYDKSIDKKNYPFLESLIEKESISFISLTSYLLDLNLIIIQEIRKLRNKTEHDYSKPQNIDAERAVAVGELFLLAFNKKIEEIRHYCEISSSKYGDNFSIKLLRTGKDLFYGKTIININGIDLNSDKKEFTILLKTLINGKFEVLPSIFGKSIPIDSIKYKVFYTNDALSFYLESLNDDLIF